MRTVLAVVLLVACMAVAGVVQAAGEFTLVGCTGTIVANYGNEVLEINLADQTYKAAFEGGEWRMCGYN